MESAPLYLVITPVRNEEQHLRQTIASFVGQTLRPAQWIIVDDGSSDGTGALIDAAAAQHAWIRAVHRRDRGFRQPGTGVIEAFYDGFALVGDQPWDFLVKFDADLAFASDYFARCLEEFARDPRLGIGGGLVCKLQAGALVREVADDPAFHVRGATKIYRRACWDQIGGLLPAPGWDSIDELKANLLGWRTGTFARWHVHQLKDTGSADGLWRNWKKNGRANYITGYHPLFMGAKCLKRAFRRPYGLAALALAYGYLSGLFGSTRRVADPALIRYVRQQQRNRLLGRPSIW